MRIAFIVFIAAVLSGLGCGVPSLTYDAQVAPSIPQWNSLRTVGIAPTSEEEDNGIPTVELDAWLAIEAEQGRLLAGLGKQVVVLHGWRQCLAKQQGTNTAQGDSTMDRPAGDGGFASCASEFQQSAGVDAVLTSQYIVVSAPLQGDVVRWHGAEVGFRSSRGASAFVYYNGRVPALSLEVLIRTPDGRLLYRNAGGIAPVNTMSFQGRLVSNKAALKNLPGLQAGVQRAFSPLIASRP